MNTKHGPECLGYKDQSCTWEIRTCKQKTNQKVVAVTMWNGSLSSVRSHFEMSQVSMVFGVLNKLERINNDVLDITPYLIFKLKNF